MDLSSKQQLELAKERFGLQDYYGAIHLLEDLIERGKAFADAHHLLGVCYELVDQPERALAAFDRALVLNPRYVEANIHRGIVLAGLGREREAERAFAAASAKLAAAQKAYDDAVKAVDAVHRTLPAAPAK